MRKCFFILTVISVCSALCPAEEIKDTQIFRGLELYTGVSAVFKNDSENSSYSINTGFRTMFRDADFRFYGNVPEFDRTKLGALFSIKRFSGIPLEFMAGNLLISGSISKMNRPYLYSSAQPLAGNTGSISGITAALPSASGTQKPYSAAAVYKYNGRGIFRKFHSTAVYNETNCFSGSALASFKTGKRSQLSVSAAAGRFKLANSSCQTWVSDTKMFPENYFLCGNTGLSFSSPFYKARLMANIYESPFGGADFTFSAENTIKIRQFTLNAAAFAAGSQEIVTADSKRLGTLRQIKINPQYTFFSERAGIRIKTGAAFLAEQKMSSGNDCAACKASFGMELRQSQTISRMSFTASGFTLSPDGGGDFDSSKYSSLLTYSFISKLRPTAAAAFAFTPPHDSKAFSSETKFRFSLRLPGKSPCSVNSSLSLTGNDSSVTKGSAKLSAVWKPVCRKIRWSAAAAVQFDFSLIN